MANFGKRALNFIICAGKAIFTAVVSIAWGLAGFFLLAALLIYFKQDATLIVSFLPWIAFIEQYWGLFFALVFFYDFITSFNKLNADEMEQQIMENEQIGLEKPLPTPKSKKEKKDSEKKTKEKNL